MSYRRRVCTPKHNAYVVSLGFASSIAAARYRASRAGCRSRRAFHHAHCSTPTHGLERTLARGRPTKENNMQTSARNQFAGEVTELKHGAVNDEVTLRTQEGLEIVSIITHG